MFPWLDGSSAGRGRHASPGAGASDGPPQRGRLFSIAREASFGVLHSLPIMAIEPFCPTAPNRCFTPSLEELPAKDRRLGAAGKSA